jgi:hypothetical protein
MTNRQFKFYIDAVRYHRHTQDHYKWVLAGEDPAEFPDYESPVEGQLTNEEIEAKLASASYVRRAPEPSPES